jgi:hypothetical protein
MGGLNKAVEIPDILIIDLFGLNSKPEIFKPVSRPTIGLHRKSLFQVSLV